MKRKRVTRVLFHLLGCLIACAVFWAWIFTFLTDTSADRKVVLYADLPAIRFREMSAALEEEDLPEGIRMVQVRPFSYNIMGAGGVEKSDLFILSPSGIEACREWLAPVPEVLRENCAVFSLDGAVYGIRIYDAETGLGAMPDFLLWEEEEDGTDRYLCFGNQSLHLPGQENAKDDAALRIARVLLMTAPE